jgi:hypothetical protein
MTKIGFIGLGTMGASFATNIIKAGFEVTVHDLHRQVAEPHLKAGATWAETPRELAAASDVILTSLPGPPEVEAVALDEAEGLVAGMATGSVLFDLSTNSPTMVRRIHGAMAEKGMHCLDAPVSGGPKGAISGKLAIWVGGDRDVFQANRGALDALGDQVEAATLGVGPSAAEARDLAVDQTRVVLPEGLVSQPQELHGSLAVVLDDDVCVGKEAARDLLATCRLQVNDDAALVAVHHQEGSRFAADVGRQEAARIVTRRRLLELDHVGAHVGKHQTAARPGHDMRELDDPDAGQWSHLSAL